MILIAGFALPNQAPAQNRATTAKPVATVLGNGRLLSINDDGTAVGGIYVYTDGKASILLGPLGNGDHTNLVGINNRGQILVAQQIGLLRYFLYDQSRKEFMSIGMIAQVRENGVPQTVQLAYLTGLDDAGRVFGVYATKHGACGVSGRPSLGAAGDIGAPPAAPAQFDFVGCPGTGVVIRSINGRGQMTGNAGRQAFLWSEGRLTLFAFPGSLSTEAAAINDAGLIVGKSIQGYSVSDDGVVTPYNKPGMTHPASFVYDGRQFRYVMFPQVKMGSYLTGINNRGKILGFFEDLDSDKSFVADIDSFPIAQMPATTSELTAAAVDRKLSAPQRGSGGDLDRAYRILQEGVGQPAASGVRAVQALDAAGPLSPANRVQELIEWGSVSPLVQHYTSVEELRKRAINDALDLLMKQLSAAQKTPKGTEAVLDAVSVLAGDRGLEDLRAAGELAPWGTPVLNSPQNQFSPAAREKFKNTIHAAITTDVAAHPLEISPRNLELWMPRQASPQQRERLDATLRQVQEQLGPTAARLFLGWNEAQMPSVGKLFSWQIVNQLVGLNTQGQREQAEQILRAFMGVPAPANCPGLGALKASGTYNGDRNMQNGSDPRSSLAEAIGARGARLIHAIP